MKKFYSRHTIISIILLSLFSIMIPQLLGTRLDTVLSHLFTWQGVGLLVAFFSLILLIVFCRDNKISLLNTNNVKQGLIYSIPLVVGILIAIIELITKQRTYDGIKFEYFSLALMAGVSEEVAFRGVPQALALKLNPSKKTLYKVVVTTSLIFALIHLTNAFGGVKIIFAVYQTILAFFYAIFISAIFIKTKNIILPIALHAINDFVAFLDVSSTKGGLIISQSFTYMDAIDTAIMVIMLIVGIYLLKHTTDEELKTLWGDGIDEEHT